MEKESSTKDVCNAIRMNKGLFNEEASLPLTLPLPMQLFHYSEWEVRAAGLQRWVYWRPRLTRSKHDLITIQKDIVQILLLVKVIFYLPPPQQQHPLRCLVFVLPRRPFEETLSVFRDRLNFILLKINQVLLKPQSAYAASVMSAVCEVRSEQKIQTRSKGWRLCWGGMCKRVRLDGRLW